MLEDDIPMGAIEMNESDLDRVHLHGILVARDV